MFAGVASFVLAWSLLSSEMLPLDWSDNDWKRISPSTDYIVADLPYKQNNPSPGSQERGRQILTLQ